MAVRSSSNEKKAKEMSIHGEILLWLEGGGQLVGKHFNRSSQNTLTVATFQAFLSGSAQARAGCAHISHLNSHKCDSEEHLRYSYTTPVCDSLVLECRRRSVNSNLIRLSPRRWIMISNVICLLFSWHNKEDGDDDPPTLGRPSLFFGSSKPNRGPCVAKPRRDRFVPAHVNPIRKCLLRKVLPRPPSTLLSSSACKSLHHNRKCSMDNFFSVIIIRKINSK